ncbi:Uncharacterised protein [Mycobacteroides abscessus subsp. abscessus]|nr:Uncharacterised protein [Mycobacteroides abscessus subsp. abscessus]
MDGGVFLFAMAAELQPLTDAGMQREQRLRSVVVDHQCRGGDMARGATTTAGIGIGVEKRQYGVAQAVLFCIGRLP